MKIFKFGGASVKDAAGVQNVVSVLKEVGFDDTLIVISAMGKSTNALEKVIKCYFENKSQLKPAIQELIEFHDQILKDLFPESKATIYTKLQ